MGLTGAGWPKRDAVLALLNQFVARQFENQRLIERRLDVEVERVEALVCGNHAARMRRWPDMGVLRGRSRRGHHSNRVQSDFPEPGKSPIVCVKKNRNADTMLFMVGVGMPASRCSI